METLQLEVNHRTDMTKGRANKIRREGFATGSVYGHNYEPISIEINIANLVHQLKQASSGATTVIDLKVKDGPANSNGMVILKDIMRDPITRKIKDIQFQSISMKEKVNVTIPVVLVGTAIGCKSGGIVDENTAELHVRCLPDNIPAKIEVDITNLKAGHHISVSDITFPEGVEVASDADTTICSCVLPQGSVQETVSEE